MYGSGAAAPGNGGAAARQGTPGAVRPAPRPASAARAEAQRRSHRGWWIALGAIVVIAGIAALTSGGLGDRCGKREPGADLAGCNLSREKLGAENLKDADLADANLSRAFAAKANLSGADLSGADLRSATLSNANLSRADLSGAQVEKSKLDGADLSGATLRNVHGLATANLQGAKGLSDKALAGAFGVSPAQVPSFLASHRVWLEDPALVHRSASQVCGGQPLAQAAARPNGTLAVVGGQASAGNSEPMARRHVRNVACTSASKSVIETCPYNIGPVDRIQRTVSIAVREARTANQIGSASFPGGYPDACPMTITFFVGEPRVIAGSPPSKSDIDSWLEQWR